MSKNEKIIVLALKLGYSTIADIIDQTGLGRKSVESSLNALCFEYNAADAAQLALIFAPQAPPKPLFTSHDCVIVDAALAPTTAATLLRQVLGDDYIQDLKTAL